MKVLYNYLNRTAGGDDDPPATVELPDKRLATVEKRFRAESAEELAEQLSAALSGEKDHHDRVVEEQERKIRARARLIEQHKRQIYMTPQVQMPVQPGQDLASGVRVLGGRQEADALLARMELARREHHAQMNKQVNLELSQGSDDDAKRGV